MEALTTMDRVWRALADPTRRALLDLLRTGPRTTGDLAELTPGLTRFAVMKHLAVLEEAGLVIAEKSGRSRLNHLNAVPLRLIYERWVSRYEDHWAASLVSLKYHIEKEHDMSTKTLPSPARIASVQTEIVINAPRQRVYDTFMHRPGDWFYPDEASRRSKSMHLEPRVGGRFYMRDEEGVKKGDENLLAVITLMRPERKIRMSGDFTMPNALLANVTIAFEDAGTGTRVHIDHRMLGEFADGDPGEFEAGWRDGLEKLKRACEGA
jgi:DNA-binding transcriptional ArsR family regulator